MKKLLWGFVAIAMFACGGGDKPNGDDDTLGAELGLDQDNDEPAISQDVINEFMNALPSPLETSVALKESGIPFTSDFLNDPDKVSNYNSAFSQAMNLGVYGADLGYANVYEQNQEALLRLDAIRDLANALNIGQFFEISTIRRLATQSSNLDSLLLITTQNFNQINDHLQSRKRSSLSVLLLAGGWVEAIYITCQVAAQDAGNQNLMERIAEQRVVCDNIKFLLDFFKETNPYINDLYTQILELSKAFEEIEIEVTYGEPEVQIVDGEAIIVDTTTQEINVTQEDVDKITQIVSSIRGSIVD